MANAILLISCEDQKGITSDITQFVFSHNGNILHADQHIDEQTNTFFMRIEWSLDDFAIERDAILNQFQSISDQYNMKVNLHFSDERPRVAVFVSKHLHCLYDLLYRYRAGHLRCEISLILSNHEDAAVISKEFGIPYEVFPITKENKQEQEAKEIELLKQYDIELLILARYHQILTPEFVAQYKERIINIHHSFLPAFVGKSPYAQAYNKGVKIIGATSHYVTADLDQGPIIEQDTIRITHRNSLEDLVRAGEDLEKIVLGRAIRLYLQRKILTYNNKTVIFD